MFHFHSRLMIMTETSIRENLTNPAPTSLEVGPRSPVVSHCSTEIEVWEHCGAQKITPMSMNLLSQCMLGGFPTHLHRVPVIAYSFISK